MKRAKPLPQPPGLRATEMVVDGEELVVLSFPSAVASNLPVGLSDSEREIIGLVCAGLSTAKIAAKRESKYRTVCNQLASIYRKLGVNSRAELVALLAQDQGLKRYH